MEKFIIAFFLQEALTDALTTATVNVLTCFASLQEDMVVLLAAQPLLCPKMASQS